jgi:effector-binding domain-containing protein
MEVKILPAVKAAYAIYRGPYHGVEAAYNRIFSFIEENKLEPVSPSRELYLNDPAMVPEEELITEVQIQVRKNNNIQENN